MKVVSPLSKVVVPVVDTLLIAPSIMFVPVKLNALVFFMPLVNLEFDTFNVPALVTASPLKPYTSPKFCIVKV